MCCDESSAGHYSLQAGTVDAPNSVMRIFSSYNLLLLLFFVVLAKSSPIMQKRAPLKKDAGPTPEVTVRHLPSIRKASRLGMITSLRVVPGLRRQRHGRRLAR